MKRLFDIVMSVFGLIVLSPLFILIIFWIIITSGFPAFYGQARVGKNNRNFVLLKFRTMHRNAEKQGLLTTGTKDQRITSSGRYLRKYKLDELPQLFNILVGNMSFVGPRPEVRKFVDLYSEKQLQVLTVKPGLTDYASLEYINENEILETETDPEEAYITKIMPAKLKLNLKYIREQSFVNDLKIIGKTLVQIF